MTDKYFTFIDNNSVTQYGLLPIRDVQGKTYHCQGVIDKLNAFYEENKGYENIIRVYTNFLKSKGYTLKDVVEFAGEDLND